MSNIKTTIPTSEELKEIALAVSDEWFRHYNGNTTEEEYYANMSKALKIMEEKLAKFPEDYVEIPQFEIHKPGFGVEGAFNGLAKAVKLHAQRVWIRNQKAFLNV